MITLDELGILYGTDKSSLIHNYCIKYDKLFNDIRKKVKNVLELGVYKGDSIRMWRDYFINATIYGIDINPDYMIKNEKNICTILGSQSDEKFLSTRFMGTVFDIIIDDGSHQYKDQIDSFIYLFKNIKPGGYYIVEDICTSYWNGFGNGDPAINYFKKLIDDVNFKGLKVGKKVDRRESLLLENANCRKDIESILFLNSIVIIKKR